LVVFLFVALPCMARAGPPFATDDPDPTEYRNWEIYLGGTGAQASGEIDADAPFAEFNYGLMPNVQFSVSVSMDLMRLSGGGYAYASGGPDVGVKMRFVQEAHGAPQVAFYPSVQFNGPLERGPAKMLLPIWMQKSWGSWTLYGGAGRWFNPGAGNRDWTFGGVVMLRRFSAASTIGVELNGATASTTTGSGAMAMNVGALISHDEHHGIVASVGRSLSGPATYTGYAAYALYFGPK
jgi:hypothetical protein